MSQPTLERIREWVTWWAEHKAESGDLLKRIERLEKAVDGLWDALSFLLEDVHHLEGRPPEALGRRLYLPRGMLVQGDVGRFG